MPPDRHAVARRVLRDWVDRECAGMTARAAKRLGVSSTLVHEVMSGERGAGMKLLDALADETGRSIDELVGRTPAQPNSSVALTSLGSLPEWKAAEQQARKRHAWVPRHAFRLARRLAGPEPLKITPEAVFFAAMLSLQLRGELEGRKASSSEDESGETSESSEED